MSNWMHIPSTKVIQREWGLWETDGPPLGFNRRAPKSHKNNQNACKCVCGLAYLLTSPQDAPIHTQGPPISSWMREQEGEIESYFGHWDAHQENRIFSTNMLTVSMGTSVWRLYLCTPCSNQRGGPLSVEIPRRNRVSLPQMAAIYSHKHPTPRKLLSRDRHTNTFKVHLFWLLRAPSCSWLIWGFPTGNPPGDIPL